MAPSCFDRGRFWCDTGQMATDPKSAADFAVAAAERPGLVDRLNEGSIDAFVEYLELAPGAKVQSINARHLAAQ